MKKYLPYSTTKEDKLVLEIGDWIDPYVIAASIVEALNEHWGIAHVNAAKTVWYSALEYLPEMISEAAKWIPDPTIE